MDKTIVEKIDDAIDNGHKFMSDEIIELLEEAQIKILELQWELDHKINRKRSA